MAYVRSCLSRLRSVERDGLRDQTERINNNFASYTLNRIDDNGNSAGVEFLKTLGQNQCMSTEQHQ